MRALAIASLLIVIAVVGGNTAARPSHEDRAAQANLSLEANAHRAWLRERLKEARRVTIGSRYEEWSPYFRPDGGISEIGRFRFVASSCEYIKLDVQFADTAGKTVAGWPIPKDARVISVSKPYLEEPFFN